MKHGLNNHFRNIDDWRDTRSDPKGQGGPNFHTQDDQLEDDDFLDNEDDLYSNEEGELDQSFEDSDLQNKDPGIFWRIISIV